MDGQHLVKSALWLRETHSSRVCRQRPKRLCKFELRPKTASEFQRIAQQNVWKNSWNNLETQEERSCLNYFCKYYKTIKYRKLKSYATWSGLGQLACIEWMSKIFVSRMKTFGEQRNMKCRLPPPTSPNRGCH